jgi:RNA polymerase sigma factor (sigma-70 family)
MTTTKSDAPPDTAHGAPGGHSSDDDFSTWYGLTYARVHTTLSLAVGDRALAEEATAEAFARALASWPQVSSKASPTAWVYTVALNEVRSRFRRLRLERRHAARERLDYADPPPDPDPQLWAAVAQLAPRARQAVALRYVADLSEAEVAEAMGISRGTVAATLSKARTRLHDLLDDRSTR